MIKTKEACCKSVVNVTHFGGDHRYISYVKTKDYSTAKETSKFAGKF